MLGLWWIVCALRVCIVNCFRGMTKGRSSQSHQQRPGPQLLQNWDGYLLNAKAEGGARGVLLKHWRKLSVFHAFPLDISFTISFDGKNLAIGHCGPMFLHSCIIVSRVKGYCGYWLWPCFVTFFLEPPHLGESSIFFQMLRPQDGKAGPVMATVSVILEGDLVIPTSEKRCPSARQVQFLYFWKAFAEAARIAGQPPAICRHVGLTKSDQTSFKHSHWNLNTMETSNIHEVGCSGPLLGLQVPWPLILRTCRWSLRCFGFVPLVMWDKSRFCLEIGWKCLWERRWTSFQWQKS